MNWRHLRQFDKGVYNTDAIGIGKAPHQSLYSGKNIRAKTGSIKQRLGISELGDFSGLASPPVINRLWEISIEGKTGGSWEFWHAYVFSSTHGSEYRLYYWEYGEATTIKITDALSNPSVWCINLFDHQFVSNGEDALHIHAGSPGSWMPVGLAAPSGAPTVSYSGGASTGYRKYKYTYSVSTDVADRPYNIESNASDELTVDFSNGEDVEITMTPSAESHASNYNLYATETYTDPNNPNTEFYLVSSQPISGGDTYDDDDSAIDTSTTYDTTDRGVPPVCGPMLWHNSRLYLIGDPNNKNIIYYSEAGKPFYFPAVNWDEVSRDDGDELTALALLGDTRYLFKKRSIYEWTGDPSTATPIKPIQATQSQNMASVGIGCYDSLSLAQNQSSVIFRAMDGHVYQLTRQALIQLSEAIAEDITDLPTGSTGAIYDDCYIISSEGTTYVCHLPSKTWQHKDTGITTSKFLVDHNGDLCYGHLDSIYQLYVGTQDEGEDFTKEFQTAYIRLAEDEEEAVFRRIVITTSERDCDFTITVYNENEQVDTGTYSTTDRHYSLPRGCRGQYISVKVSWTGTAIIESVGIGFLKRGRRH